MTQPAVDPGYRDLDRSAGFDEILASLDYFDSAPYVVEVRRILRRVIRPTAGMRLLDAGCGPGLDVAVMASSVAPSGNVVGLDISRRMIEVARRRHHLKTGNAHFLQGDLRKVGYPDDFFDAVWSMRTLQYLDEPSEGLRELARATRPGGKVVVIEGGMTAVDLPESPLKRLVFGPRPGLGMRLPVLMRDAGLTRIAVKPAFAFEIGEPDPKVLEYAAGSATAAVDDGIATPEDVERWLAELEKVSRAERWFSAGCMFVVVGTIPRGR